MITIAEYLLVRVQNRFGIPKWRLYVVAWCLYAVAAVLRPLVYQRSIVVDLFLAVWIVAFSHVGAYKARQDQEHADRNLLIVRNEEKVSRLSNALRRISVVVLVISLVPPIRALDISCSALLLAAFCLGQCDTFPMVGPTLSERIRSLFTMRKTATNSA